MLTPTFPEQPDNNQVTPAEALAAIGRGNPTPAELAGLSDLTRQDARTLAEMWPRLAEPLREFIQRETTELGETNFLLTFGRVHRIGLTDSSAVVRQLAVIGLWEDEDSRLAPIFVKLMQSDPSVDVRAEAARALGLFADFAIGEEIDEDLAETVMNALKEAMTDVRQSDLVRRRALESYSTAGDDPEVEQLIREHFDSDDNAARVTAIFAMGRSGGKRWLDPVLNSLFDNDNEIRYEAARAAGQLGFTDAIESLAKLASDEDTDVRQSAIASIGFIGGKPAVRALKRISATARESDVELIDSAMEEAQMFAGLPDFLP